MDGNNLLRKSLWTLLAALAVLGPVLSGAANPPGAGNGSDASKGMTPERILQMTDRARGGGLPGLQWNLRIKAEDPDVGSDEREMLVRVAGDDSVAETTYPPRAAGGRLLQLNRNMWYGRPDLSKAVSISSRQKLIGPAANGDIASTNYLKDYNVVLLREEDYKGEAVWVLGLSAKAKFVTYDRIEYFVSKKTILPVKAAYLTVSGKLFKTAEFEFKNEILVDGKRQPFVSRMTIHDTINSGNVSVLDYRQVKLANVSRHDLSVEALTR